MTDILVCVPKARWADWVGEGDPAGTEWSGDFEYVYSVRTAPDIKPGERVYIAALGKLRGYAPLVRVDRTSHGFGLVRRGGAVAVTIPEPVRGFPGWRVRWWDRGAEMPFPDWRRP